MLGRKYILSCHGCSTEFYFKSAKSMRAFANQSNRCPCCGGSLSQVPILRMMMTPPPELKSYPVYVRTVEMDRESRLLDFKKWPYPQRLY